MNYKFIVESVYHHYLCEFERNLQDKLNAIKNDGGKDINVTVTTTSSTFAAIIIYKKETA